MHIMSFLNNNNNILGFEAFFIYFCFIQKNQKIQFLTKNENFNFVLFGCP
jgi:hypothetical protein